VAILRPGAFRSSSREGDVDRALVQGDLALDVLAPSFHEVVLAHDGIISDLRLQTSESAICNLQFAI
jgi:hypothetical protein